MSQPQLRVTELAGVKPVIGIIGVATKRNDHGLLLDGTAQLSENLERDATGSVKVQRLPVHHAEGLEHVGPVYELDGGDVIVDLMIDAAVYPIGGCIADLNVAHRINDGEIDDPGLSVEEGLVLY